MASKSKRQYFGLVVDNGPGKENKEIPLKSVAVSGRIKGYVYGLETKLSYLNTSDDPLEVVFRFPVDESSAVVGLEARINGRTIKGEVREKEEARQMYDDALSSGLTAALGEEKIGDIFSIALGNLPPKGEAEIVLKLCGEMSVDKNVEAAARFTLPTVLKPRYTPTGSTDPLETIGGAEGGSQIEKGSAPAVSSFSVVVDRSERVSSITSPTHGIKTCSKDNGCMEVTLADSGPLDKDLVILVQYKDPHTPSASVEKGNTSAAKGNELMSNPAVMLEFFPKFTSLQAACEFLFVVDRSGSMQGEYINSAKETLVLFLKSIPPGCYFNIIGFGSSYEHLFPSSVPYDQNNLDKAMKHAHKLKADLGGTELLRPLEYAFDQKLLSGLPRQIFVLTDGSVSNTDACISLTRKNVHSARVFTFGIGSGASSALVKGLARAGNGSAEFIKEGERMQGKVIGSLKKALQPSVTDVELKFSVPKGVEVVQAPNKIPPVFNGEKVVLYGWMKGGNGRRGECSAVLKGKMLGSLVEHKIDFLLEDGSLASSDIPVVHQLAAKSLIKDWEEDDKDKKKAIIKLSIESGVISSYTSYIAVDQDQNKPIEGAIKTYNLTANVVPYFMGGCYGGRGRGSTSLKKRKLVKRNQGASTCVKKSASKRRCIAPTRQSKGRGASSAKKSASKKRCAAPTRQRKRASGLGVLYPEFDDESDDDDEDNDKMDTSHQTNVNNSGLSLLIALQSAEGSWSLSGALASVVGRSLSDLKASCPSGCSEVVWGTVLALALLETKYSGQHDEWELLSMKSEMWLQGQTIPAGSTIPSLTQQAKQAL